MGDEEESIKATIAGLPIAVRGVNMAVVIILAVALMGGGYLFFEQMKSSNIIRTLEHEHIVDGLNTIKGVNEHIGELVEEQNYIVLSDDKDRQEMRQKLRRPLSLTKKLEH